MITLRDAEALLRGLAVRAEPVQVPLGLAAGRIAALALVAPGNLPPLPRCAMDGYALAVDPDRPADGVLALAGELYPGQAPGQALATGQCLAVTTGTTLPPGANAVVPRERTRAEPAGIRVLQEPRPGDNVILPGELGRTEALLVPSGTRLGGRHLAACAAYGLESVAVRAPLRVAILATGDELVDFGQAAGPHQVHNSGGPALAAELAALGLAPEVQPTCPDRIDELTAAFGRLLASGRYGAIVTTGGVSVGNRDLVPAAWERAGVRRAFWRVAAKPGRAIYVGSTPEAWIFSLSGNPHAALAAYYALVRPALAALAGLALGDRRTAGLAAPVESRRDGFRLIWAEAAAPGVVRPLRGLSILETLVRAQALVLVPPGERALPAGATVDVIALDAGGLAP